MRAIWSGVISFGLVNIPVNLFSASHEESFDFDFLHKKDLSRIRYARICVAEEKEVPYTDIVRGAQVKKNKYVVLDQKDFASAYPRATRTIDIEHFVNEAEIDPIYYDKPYYLAPDPKSLKPYRLLMRTLEHSKKVAVARYVLRHRQSLAIIKPLGNVLLLNQLRWHDAIRHAPAVSKTEKFSAQEQQMAMSIISRGTQKFNPWDYRDDYTRKIRHLIHTKGKGHAVEPREEAPQPTKVSDLMAHLKASLEHQQTRARSRAMAR